MATTHKCPVKGCERQVINSRLMCVQHWRRVPCGLQQAVWRTYRKAPSSALHRSAMQAAVAAVNALIGGEPASDTPTSDL